MINIKSQSYDCFKTYVRHLLNYELQQKFKGKVKTEMFLKHEKLYVPEHFVQTYIFRCGIKPNHRFAICYHGTE